MHTVRVPLAQENSGKRHKLARRVLKLARLRLLGLYRHLLHLSVLYVPFTFRRMTFAAMESILDNAECTPQNRTRYTRKYFVLPNLLCFLCVCCHPIHSGRSCGRTSRGHTGGRSHRISPPSFCGACLHFYREKDLAVPLPRRPWCRICVPTN